MASGLKLPRWKRGYIHPETGMVFEGYGKLSKNGENWLTPEKFKKRLQYKAAWRREKYQSDLEGSRESDRKYRDDNRELIRAAQRRADRKRRSDPVKRLICNSRSRLSGFISGKFQIGKVGSFMANLGCDLHDLRSHIEAQFVSGMNWCNYGNKKGCWSLDHVRPLSSAETFEELVPLLHYTNLAPMWHVENIRKGNRWTKG